MTAETETRPEAETNPPGPAARLALSVGAGVSSLLRVTGSRLEPAAPAVKSRGRIPAPEAFGSDGTRPDWVVCGAEVPRVTIDGRTLMNPATIQATAAAALRAGAVIAGPLPSEAVPTDLFTQELARQETDILVLTQPIAGEKARLVAEALEQRAFGDRTLTIIYNGPPGYELPEFNELEGCEFVRVEGSAPGARDRIDIRATERALEEAVRRHLGARLARAGYTGVDFRPAGTAAAAAARGLPEMDGWMDTRHGNGRGPGGRPPADACLVLAEPDRATLYAVSGDRLDVASTGFAGTGSTDLLDKEKGRPGSAAREGWLPEWPSLAARLPFGVDPTDLANAAASALVEQWTPPGSLAEASLGAALLEELIARLLTRWQTAVGRDAPDLGHCRFIAATGYGFSRLGNARHAAYALLNVFQPVGVSVLAVDHSGTLLARAAAPPDAALDPPLPEPVVVVVSPLRARMDWQRAGSDPWAIVTVEREDGRQNPRRLTPGALTTIPLPPGETATLIVEPCRRDIDFGAGPGRIWKGSVPGGEAGIVLDGRGRPLEAPSDPDLGVTLQREWLTALGVLRKERARQ